MCYNFRKGLEIFAFVKVDASIKANLTADLKPQKLGRKNRLMTELVITSQKIFPFQAFFHDNE